MASINNVWEIIHAENYAAFCLSIIDGCCPEVAFMRLREGKKKNGKSEDILPAVEALRAAGLKWREIECYVGAKGVISQYSRWKKKLRCKG